MSWLIAYISCRFYILNPILLGIRALDNGFMIRSEVDSHSLLTNLTFHIGIIIRLRSTSDGVLLEI